MNRRDGDGEGMKKPSRFQEPEVVLAGEWAGEPSPELLGPKDILDKHIISHSLDGQPFLRSTTLRNAGTVTALLTTD